MTECAHCGEEFTDETLDTCTVCSAPICDDCGRYGTCDVGPSMEDDRIENPRELPL